MTWCEAGETQAFVQIECLERLLVEPPGHDQDAVIGKADHSRVEGGMSQSVSQPKSTRLLSARVLIAVMIRGRQPRNGLLIVGGAPPMLGSQGPSTSAAA